MGKAATFVKVDHVLQETKNLMSVINNVVTKCFECAEKVKHLNFFKSKTLGCQQYSLYF